MILWPPVAVFVLPSLCLTNKKSVSDERPVFHRPGKHAKFLKAIVNKTKKNQTNKVSHPTPPETASSTSAAGTTPPPNPGAAAAAGPKKRKGLYGSFSEGLETYRRDVGAIRSMLTQIPDDPRAIDGGDCAMHRMFFKSIAKQAERCAAFCNALVQIVRVQAAFRGRRVRRSFCISSSPQSQSQSQPQAHPTVVPRMMKLWKSAELRARNDALRDLMKVEITFRRKVSALRDGFAAPLRQSLETKAPLLTGQEIAAIFSPLDAVAAIDDTIYKKLDEVYSTHWPFVCNVGEVFTSVAPQLSAYGQYSKNVPIAVQTVIMLSQTNPRFATFLAQVELEGDLEGARLIDLLPAPLQQISKYEISMQSLMEATAKLAHNNAFSHLIPPTELESLATATTLLQRVNMVLYVSYEMSSNRSMVVSILKNLANSKALEGESSRRFISEGDCTIVSKSHLLHKESKRHFFLFNDVLALAKRNRISYNAKELLWLKTVKLEPVPPTDGGATSIMLVSPQRSILMILSTPSQAAEMETQISFLIQSSVSPALVFGGDLSELVIRDSSNGVPSVLQILANLLLPHLGTEGIFREAGNKQKIEELQRAFNESKWEGVDIIGEYGIHSVASTFKSFFSTLLEPLFPYPVYDKMVTLADNKTISNAEKLSSMKTMLTSMPTCNKNVLSFLLQFISTAATHSASSMMTPRNLSIVFTPAILRPQVVTVETTVKCLDLVDLVQILVEDCNEIMVLDKPEEGASPTALPKSHIERKPPQQVQPQAHPQGPSQTPRQQPRTPTQPQSPGQLQPSQTRQILRQNPVQSSSPSPSQPTGSQAQPATSQQTPISTSQPLLHQPPTPSAPLQNSQSVIQQNHSPRHAPTPPLATSQIHQQPPDRSQPSSSSPSPRRKLSNTEGGTAPVSSSPQISTQKTFAGLKVKPPTPVSPPATPAVTQQAETEPFFPLSVLQARPLPAAVDSTRIPFFLSPTEFMATFGMTKDSFNKLPPWKQTTLKKETGLF